MPGDIRAIKEGETKTHVLYRYGDTPAANQGRIAVPKDKQEMLDDTWMPADYAACLIIAKIYRCYEKTGIFPDTIYHDCEY